MKKFLLAILLLVAVIFTTSCSHTPVSTQPTDTKAPEVPEETPNVESPATNEITWDQSKYEVSLFYRPKMGRKDAFEFKYKNEHDFEKQISQTILENSGTTCNGDCSDSPETEFTLEICGESYAGELCRVYCYESCSRHKYKYESLKEDGSLEYVFYFDDTGRVTSFSLYDFDSMVDDTAPKLSSTEALAKAEEYLKQLTGIELSNSPYKAEITKEEYRDAYIYSISFRMYVGEIKTSNYFEIEITESGRLLYYRDYRDYRDDATLNFDGVDVSSIDMNEINSVFDDALEYIYGYLRESSDLSSFERGTPTLSISSDGEIYLWCRYSLSMMEKGGGEDAKCIASEENTMSVIILNNK